MRTVPNIQIECNNALFFGLANPFDIINPVMVSIEGKRLIYSFAQNFRSHPGVETQSIHAGGWGSWNSRYDNFMDGLRSAIEIAPDEAPKPFANF